MGNKASQVLSLIDQWEKKELKPEPDDNTKIKILMMHNDAVWLNRIMLVVGAAFLVIGILGFTSQLCSTTWASFGLGFGAVLIAIGLHRSRKLDFGLQKVNKILNNKEETLWQFCCGVRCGTVPNT